MTDTKRNIKKAEPSKVFTIKKYTLNEAMLEFQKLSVTAKKDGKNPHFRSNYSKLESVIEAVNQGNKFGLFFTQEIDYVWVSHRDATSVMSMMTVHMCQNCQSFLMMQV